MTFGEKLKELRNRREWTQPEMADAIGIEQSYLSKLENDKSLPSNEIFLQILEVLSVDIEAFLGDLDQRSKNQLRQLPAVAEFFRRERQMLIGNRRRWLLVSATLVTFGVAMIYAGFTHLFYPNVVYQYKSYGIVLEGEPKELIRHPHAFISERATDVERRAFIDSIKERIDEDYRISFEYIGNIYNVTVDGGSRTYHLTDETEIDPWQNKMIVFLGVLLGTFGAIGFLTERKLAGGV